MGSEFGMNINLTKFLTYLFMTNFHGFPILSTYTPKIFVPVPLRFPLQPYLAYTSCRYTLAGISSSGGCSGGCRGVLP